jgi:SAM-dependent methyltransferase
MLVGTREQLRHHYAVECELAERLRGASREARRMLYNDVYDELLRRVPHHPLLRARYDSGEMQRRERSVAGQLRFLKGFLTLRSVFLEIGGGDCALSLSAAGYAERVYSIEVCAQIVGMPRPQPNLKLALSDGVNIPIADASVDVAFSDQVMQHVHPEDAREQLENIRRCLVEGGIYICFMPHRLRGPQDISGHFDEQPRGLHLREYSAREARRLFREAGFRRVRFYAGARGFFFPVPFLALALCEAMLEKLPRRLRRALADSPLMHALLGLRVMATK